MTFDKYQPGKECDKKTQTFSGIRCLRYLLDLELYLKSSILFFSCFLSNKRSFSEMHLLKLENTIAKHCFDDNIERYIVIVQ